MLVLKLLDWVIKYLKILDIVSGKAEFSGIMEKSPW